MQMPEVRPEVAAVAAEVVEFRRDLHRHPELAFREHRTSARVAAALREMGLSPQTGVAETGVVATIEGAAPGPTLLLRADMDALPVQEESGVEFASLSPGLMHACGHDMHTAVLLGTARVLQQLRPNLRGRVKLVFQPAEEGPGGALPMIEQGVLKSPDVDYALGLHMWAELPCGHVAVQSGPVMAAADTFRVTIEGRGGHAAAPHETADPIVAAAALIGAMQTLVSRRTDPFDTAVVSVTQIQGGTADNIIPAGVEFSGTIRTFLEPVRQRIVEQLRELVELHCRAYGVTGKLHFQPGYPPLSNHATPTSWVQQSARELGLPLERQRSAGGEDMAYFLREVPGAFFFLGAALDDIARHFPHHHPKFELDERAIPLGIELLVRCTEHCLSGENLVS